MNPGNDPSSDFLLTILASPFKSKWRLFLPTVFLAPTKVRHLSRSDRTHCIRALFPAKQAHQPVAASLQSPRASVAFSQFRTCFSRQETYPKVDQFSGGGSFENIGSYFFAPNLADKRAVNWSPSLQPLSKFVMIESTRIDGGHRRSSTSEGCRAPLK